MTKSPTSTYILIGLNVLVYAWLAVKQQSLMMDTNADALAILHTGANLNPLTLGGEPWRMITSMFLHYGLIHLGVNMYALFVLGTSLEPAVGTARFLLIYFFCGIAAGIASLVFNIFTPSAGASGALFGLFGYQLGAEVIGNFHDRQKLLSIFLNFAVFIIINTAIASGVNVDVAGHIGGFFGGVVLAALHFKLRWFIRKEFLALLLLVLCATLFALPKDQVQYYRIFKSVLDLDDHTSNLYKNATSDAELKDSLAATVPRWDSIASSIKNLKKVPAGVEEDTSTLNDYASLRKRGTYYRVKLIERESYIYYDSIEILDAEFKSLPRLRYVLNFKVSEPDEPIDTVSNNMTLTPAKVYYDSHWRETDDILLAMYYRIGNKDSIGRWHGVVGDYYKNGLIQMKGKYVRDMKDGIFIYYSDRKTYQSAGRYKEERSIGKWENFHWNGALESEVYYGDEVYTANVFDSLGNPQVVNGNGKFQQWYSNGQLREEGEYRSGKKEGLWFGYRPDGKPYFKEEYRNNRLIHGVSQGEDGRMYVYDHLSEYPFPVDGMPAFKKYIEANKRVPEGSKHGTVKLVFSIGVDGTTWNPVVIQSVSPEHDQEAIRLLNEGPRWRTSLLHGQEKVPSQGYIEIDF